MKTERELFEEAFKKVNSGVSFWLNTWSDEDNDYGHLTASWGWHMWQASANRQGYKLVPLEASKSCLSNLGDVIFDNFGTTVTEVDRCAEKAYKAMIGAIE